MSERDVKVTSISFEYVTLKHKQVFDYNSKPFKKLAARVLSGLKPLGCASWF